jgi:tetratricopeptide (TPR) repeat protein
MDTAMLLEETIQNARSFISAVFHGMGLLNAPLRPRPALPLHTVVTAALFVIGLFTLSTGTSNLGALGQESTRETTDFVQVLRDGRSLLSSKRFSEAAVCFHKYTQRYPSDPTGFFFLGVLADEAGQLEESASFYARSLKLAKSLGLDAEELRLNLGNTLLKLNYLDEAQFDYRRAIEINSKNQMAHLNLSKALLLKGDYQQALNELNKCTELGFEEDSLPLLRALALKRLGRIEESKKEASKYLEHRGVNPPELKRIVLDLF